MLKVCAAQERRRTRSGPPTSHSLLSSFFQEMDPKMSHTSVHVCPSNSPLIPPSPPPRVGKEKSRAAGPPQRAPPTAPDGRQREPLTFPASDRPPPPPALSTESQGTLTWRGGLADQKGRCARGPGSGHCGWKWKARSGAAVRVGSCAL